MSHTLLSHTHSACMHIHCNLKYNIIAMLVDTSSRGRVLMYFD